MKHFYPINILLITLILCGACTHEYVLEIENDWRIDVGLNFTDPEFWPEGQLIRIGVFEENNARQAVASVLVDQPEDKIASVSLSHVPEGTYQLQLYLTENGVFKVALANLGEIKLIENLEMESQAVSLLSYSRVQDQVFNNCQLCHGGSSGDLAAGLNLTSENSFNSLVNVTAAMNPSMIRVLPGSANYSYLVKVLNKDIDFDHAASSSATDADKQLIIDWINEGAKNN